MDLDALADPEEQVEVAVERRLDAGPQHLDGDLPALRVHGEVHLRDRGGGNRLFVEAAEQLFQRPVELVLDGRSDLVEREGRQAVHELRQVGCDLLAEQVGPARQRLTQLDERRAGVLERARELLAETSRLPAHEGAQHEHQQACRVDAVEDEQRVVPRQDADQREQAQAVAQLADHPGNRRRWRSNAVASLRPPPSSGGAVPQRHDQVRQAECSAAMPPERFRQRTTSSPAARIIAANASCEGKRRMLSAR